jgi:hypothetical protein
MSERPEAGPQRAARERQERCDSTEAAMAERGAELARLVDVGIIGNGTDTPSVVLRLALRADPEPREVWLALPAADVTDIMTAEADAEKETAGA